MVVFQNTNEDGSLNLQSRHAGLPVISGEKWAFNYGSEKNNIYVNIYKWIYINVKVFVKMGKCCHNTKTEL